MKTSKDYRAAARESLNGHWKQAAIMALVFSAIGGLLSGPFVLIDNEKATAGASSLVSFLIIAPISVGIIMAILKFIRTQDDNFIGNAFNEAFNDYLHKVLTIFITTIFVLLWTLLFFIPGIIMGYAYRLNPYLLQDNPELSELDTIRLSKNMMKGHKWELFVLQLSFIGWILLSLLSLGIGLLWVIPYMQVAEAHFYEDVKAEYELKATIA